MLELLIVLFLIACNAFFALSEMSVVTSRKGRLKQLAQTHRTARHALVLAEHPERFLSTVQVGITLIGILTGMFGGDAIGRSIGEWLLGVIPALGTTSHTLGVVLAVSLITFLTIVFGELLPKRLALLAPERLASVVALPMMWISRAAAPAVWLLSASVRSVLRLLRLDRTEAAQVSEEEIRLLVSEGHEQGVIDDAERNMMNRVLNLGDRDADSLMTPRTRITWLDAGKSFEENLATMRATPFSRYPVLRGSDADVIGVLEVKSLIDRLDEHEFELFKYLREPLFVSDSTPAMKLLEIFREDQQSLALVVDEYGDITGLISVNDLLEAVIGRTQTRDGADATPLVVAREDGSLLVDGALTIDHVRELLGGGALPNEELHDYHTAAGMTIAQFGRIPHTGESFQWAGWRVEVVDLDGPRVDKLLLQRLPVQAVGDDG
ncbi:HlyC/CorC family transporter [Luteimonas yindakuii]|uniref:HlyC/CorC family transporter n=1 Tax=Luteimonas yindakuii TaxID=2565782 RepID=A0A4Z1R5U6_9GAMM|nr:hemolysin family protein [Luteimonas yindakuii]QCO67962.1 HlyC/CorC family transporter [Luteimonas yindakuii]TKS54296.1 HlyC/CorC family transporter [Luteimonas yindakuii]